MPTLSYPILSLPICLLIAFNLGMHYYHVCTVSPGFTDQPSATPGHGFMWAKPKNERALTTGSYPEQTSVRVTLAKLSQCRKCMQMRPERSHHCRICNRCILKFDHHCPWINQCVGIHNERHFVMFMAYLCLASFCFITMGFDKAKIAMGLSWPVGSTHLLSFRC
jgi:palmitoyltransferase